MALAQLLSYPLETSNLATDGTWQKPQDPDLRAERMGPPLSFHHSDLIGGCVWAESGEGGGYVREEK
ncbi:hypothetical protein KXW98_006024, partial [Aspergillus fumigatus]